MELRQLEYFQSVARYSSFTRAAEEMHVSQPAITTAIKTLEEELSFKLFIRERKRVLLTAEGTKYLEMITPLIAGLLKAAEEVRQLSAESNLQINIGVAPISGALLLADLYGDFSEKNPKIRTNIYEMGSYGLLKAIDTDQIDLAYMVILDDVIERYDYETVETGNIRVVMNRQMPLADLESVTIKQLEGLPVVLLPGHSYVQHKVDEAFLQAKVTPNVLCRPSQMFTVFNLLSHKLGISFVLSDGFTEASRAENLVSIPLEPPIPFKMGFVWKKDRRLNQAAQMCIKYVKSRYGTGNE